MLVHTVFFTLKPELTEAQRAGFVQDVSRLGEIPGLLQFRLGKPAAVEARPVVDKEFDFSITCWLEDVASHDAYQEHPVHLEFIERQKANWSRVRVFDFEELV